MKKDKEKKIENKKDSCTENEAVIDDCEETSAKSTEKTVENNSSEQNQLKKELDDLNDKFLRLYADFENFKKRTKSEKEVLYSTASAETIAAFLPVIDNIERALSAVENDDSPMKKGVEMVYQQVNKSLSQLNIECYGARGDKFDPAIHEAVMYGESESDESNSITDVMQKGYRVGDRIIRHALVKVVN